MSALNGLKHRYEKRDWCWLTFLVANVKRIGTGQASQYMWESSGDELQESAPAGSSASQ